MSDSGGTSGPATGIANGDKESGFTVCHAYQKL